MDSPSNHDHKCNHGNGIVTEAEVLSTITEEIQYKHQKPHFNFGTKMQTSVGLIFRVSDECRTASESFKARMNYFRQRDENHYLTERLPHAYLRELFKDFEQDLKFDLLVTMRKKNPSQITDMYSNQVRFPGGKCEGIREDDFSAVVRAVKEDSSFDLQDINNHTIYLGYLPKNFYTGRVESRSATKMARDVLTRAHIFLVLDAHVTNQFAFGETTEAVKWIPFKNILGLDHIKDVSERHVETPREMMSVFPSFMQKLAENGVKELVFVSLEIGMPRPIWGLHATILVYFMSIFIKGVEIRKKKHSHAYEQYDPLITRWNEMFNRFAQTYSTQESSAVVNFLIKHYFKAWKDEFHKTYRQSEGLDYTFMTLIGVSALVFSLDFYYKSLGRRPSL